MTKRPTLWPDDGSGGCEGNWRVETLALTYPLSTRCPTASIAQTASGPLTTGAVVGRKSGPALSAES